MKPEELQKLQYEEENPNQSLLIDVREKEEYMSGHLRYAINYPVSEIMKNNKKLANYKDKPIILYCHSGGRSAYCKGVLSLFGFKNVINGGGVTAYNYDLTADFTNLCTSQFVEKVKEKNATIIDIRTKEEFDKWSVPTAINLRTEDIDENIETIPKDKDVVIYSKDGYEGVRFAQKLANKGYKNIYNLISKAVKEELI